MIIINLYCTVPISAVSLCAVWYFKRYYTLHRNPYLLRLSFDRCLRLLRPSSRDLDLLLFLLIFLTDLSLSSLSLLSLLSLSLDIVTATAHWHWHWCLHWPQLYWTWPIPASLLPPRSFFYRQTLQLLSIIIHITHIYHHSF